MRTNNRTTCLAATSLWVLAASLTITNSGCGTRGAPTSPPPTGTARLVEGTSTRSAGLDLAIEAQNRHTARLMSIPGVVGTGTSRRADGQHEILVLSRQAGVRGIPASLDGIPVEVMVVGDVRAYGKTGIPAVLECGTSTGNDAECSAGTIACVVEKGSAKYLLSNNHVFARENQAAIGEGIDAPGRYDAQPKCTQTPICGTLAAFKPISFTSDNSFDAALALPDPDRPFTCAEAGGYTPTSTVAAPYIGQLVKKSGRTSGVTHAKVIAINVTVRVGYSTGVATFVNQILTPGNFLRVGDSGALMVEETTNNPVGLCFAGGGNASFANPIGPVLRAFRVTVCTR